MRRLVVITILALVAVACGATTIDSGGTNGSFVTTTTTPSTTTTTKPSTTSRHSAELDAARTLWAANQPDSYEFTYSLECECDTGPWRVRVNSGGTTISSHLGIPIVDEAPFQSIDSIFDEIEKITTDGRYPVEVTYDSNLGYPQVIIFNEPELASDGGFILRVQTFDDAPDVDRAEAAAQLAAARQMWAAAGYSDYQYTFSRSCFCMREFIGPFAVTVSDNTVTTASYNGTDLLDSEIHNIDDYSELIQTVEEMFSEIERGVAEADSVQAEYDPITGHPTNVYIDWSFQMADEESGFSVDQLLEVLG